MRQLFYLLAGFVGVVSVPAVAETGASVRIYEARGDVFSDVVAETGVPRQPAKIRSVGIFPGVDVAGFARADYGHVAVLGQYVGTMTRVEADIPDSSYAQPSMQAAAFFPTV